MCIIGSSQHSTDSDTRNYKFWYHPTGLETAHRVTKLNKSCSISRNMLPADILYHLVLGIMQGTAYITTRVYILDILMSWRLLIKVKLWSWTLCVRYTKPVRSVNTAKVRDVYRGCGVVKSESALTKEILCRHGGSS